MSNETNFASSSSSPSSSQWNLLSTALFGAGIAVAVYNKISLEPTFSLFMGAIGMSSFSQFLGGEKEGAMVRVFTAGFISAGIFQHHFF